MQQKLLKSALNIPLCVVLRLSSHHLAGFLVMISRFIFEDLGLKVVNCTHTLLVEARQVVNKGKLKTDFS